MSAPAFVIGCPRSGTSVLGELIAAHPETRYVFENLGGFPQRDGHHRLVAADATPGAIERLRGVVDELAGERLLVDKSPRLALRVPFIRAVWPDCKIVHIVRDGRDAACSLMPGIGGDDWLHAKPPGWAVLQERRPGLERCARYWRNVVGITLADLDGQPHKRIRYEDLVRRPVDTMQGVLTYLGLPWCREVNAACQRVQNKTAGSYHAHGQDTWYRNDHSQRIGRWRENMTAAEVTQIEPIVWPLLTRLGYGAMDV